MAVYVTRPQGHVRNYSLCANEFIFQTERLFFVVCLTVTNLLDQEDFRNSLPDQVRPGEQ